MDRQPQYTLPGVIHYLQSEWSRNERDRIQWAIEREEMKSTIARLNSENTSLKAINKQLRENFENDNEVVIEEKNFGEVDINPLAEARQHLKDRMNEVLYILKSTDSNPDPLGLADNLGFFAKDDLHSKPANLSTLPSPHELQQRLQQKEPLKERSIEQSDEILSSKQKKVLSSHMSRINNLSLYSNQLLSSSLDMTVKLWTLKDLEIADIKPLKTFKDADAVFLKWINDTLFITANETSLKLWNKDNEINKTEIKIKGIKDLDVIEDWLVIVTDSLEIYELNSKDMSISQKHKLQISPQSATIDGKNVYVYTDSIQRIDLQTGESETIETKGLTITNPVIKIQKFNNQISLITKSKLFIYNITSCSIDFSLSQPGISHVESISSKTIVFYKTGTVEVYSSSKLVRQFNHFEPIFGGIKYTDLKDDEKDMFGNSDNVGILLNEEFVITGGEDSTIRIFGI